VHLIIRYVYSSCLTTQNYSNFIIWLIVSAVYTCKVVTSVIIMKSCLCRFIVRDFEYDARAIEDERAEKHKLDLQLKKQFVSASAASH